MPAENAVAGSCGAQLNRLVVKFFPKQGDLFSGQDQAPQVLRRSLAVLLELSRSKPSSAHQLVDFQRCLSDSGISFSLLSIWLNVLKRFSILSAAYGSQNHVYNFALHFGQVAMVKIYQRDPGWNTFE
jgi:hypothetical protein